jgi:hypothetical protein
MLDCGDDRFLYLSGNWQLLTEWGTSLGHQAGYLAEQAAMLSRLPLSLQIQYAVSTGELESHWSWTRTCVRLRRRSGTAELTFDRCMLEFSWWSAQTFRPMERIG